MVGRSAAQYIWKNNQRKQGWLKFFIPILDPGSGWSWIQIDNYFRPIWPKLLPGGWDPWRGGEARRGGRWTSCLGKQDWVPPLLPQVWKLHNCSSTKLSDIYLSIQRMYTQHTQYCVTIAWYRMYQLSSNQCFENQRKPAFSVLPLGSEMSGDFHTCATRTVEVWFSYL